MPIDRLIEYRRKRTDGTIEPFGDERPTAPSNDKHHHGLFVVQLHHARRTHYDLRLELDGVLVSWAVPKGFCLDPEEKRFAVQTEDHPLEYGDFEGVIPEGNYGAGAMIVWDRGVWISITDPWEGFRSGKLLFELRGFKLRGVWTMFRIKPPAIHRGKQKDDGKNWLMMKKPDGFSRLPGDAGFVFDETSVLSGLSGPELGEGSKRLEAVHRSIKKSKASKPGTPVDPRTLDLQLAQNGDQPSDRRGWLFEIKYDGYRLVAAKSGADPYLRYRNGHDATHLFPEIARTLRNLPVDRVVIDGEVIVPGLDGKPSFNGLQQRALLSRSTDIERASIQSPASLFAFDLLEVDGTDLRALPLIERKALLQQLLPTAGPVRYCEHIETIGKAFYAQVEQMGLEGMMGKRASSRYLGGRSESWLRYRVEHTGDFVIVGYSLPKASRKGFGALHLGLYGDGDGDGDVETLHYLGRVGTGFSNQLLDELGGVLESIHDDAVLDQLDCDLPSGDRHRWVSPRVVCEIRFKERTKAGMLRHPVFLSLRTDKEPRHCTLTSALPGAPAPPDSGKAAFNSPGVQSTTGPDGPGERSAPIPAPAPVPEKVTFSNRDKIFWPEDHYTKGDLIDYYRAIAPWILPYLKDRPVVLTRYPDGIHGKSFFQKNAPDFAPEWIQTVTIHSEGSQRDIDYFVCNDEDTLLYLANLGTIPLHVWSSRVETIDRPDWSVIDLDPKDAPFAHVIRLAREIKKLCDELGLPTYVKTSGSTGLHVLVPLGQQLDFRGSRTLAELIARLVVERNAEIATVARALSDREGKVYIDYGQNGWGKLIVAPFCLRPNIAAPVSATLKWTEVRKGLTIQKHNLKTVPKRMKKLKADPFLDVLEGDVPNLTKLMAGSQT